MGTSASMPSRPPGLPGTRSAMQASMPSAATTKRGSSAARVPTWIVLPVENASPKMPRPGRVTWITRA